MSEGLVVVCCVVWLSGLRGWRLFGCELAIRDTSYGCVLLFFSIKEEPLPKRMIKPAS